LNTALQKGAYSEIATVRQLLAAADVRYARRSSDAVASKGALVYERRACP
jgi:hypothetical protein